MKHLGLCDDTKDTAHAVRSGCRVRHSDESPVINDGRRGSVEIVRQFQILRGETDSTVFRSTACLPIRVSALSVLVCYRVGQSAKRRDGLLPGERG